MTPPSLRTLSAYVDRGLVTLREHDGLVVANYTPKCQHEEAWDEVTLQARGLVYETATSMVVARPWPKFFNLGEAHAPAQLPDRNPVITEKMDGSLGIGFVWRGRVHWTTRGSLTSPQAAVAQRIWNEQHQGVTWREGDTLLAEIVGPETRVIVDYPRPRLVLLGVRLRNGSDLSQDAVEEVACELGMPAVERFAMSLEEAVEKVRTMPAGREGLVARWGSLRVKLKSPAYLRVARLLSGLTERRAIDLHLRGEVLPAEVSEETRAWFEETVGDFEAEAGQLGQQAMQLAEGWADRRAFALAHRGHPLFHLAVRVVAGVPMDARLHAYKQRFGGDPR